MPNDDAADVPEQTQADPATGTATTDFVGVKMRLDAINVRSLNVDADRMRFTVSIPIRVGTLPLINEMLLHIRQEIFVGFGFLQGALPFPDGDGVTTTTDPKDANVILEATNSIGDKFFPHHFIRGDAGKCGACELVQTHGIHSEASIEARQKLQGTGTATADKPRRGRPPHAQANGNAPEAETNEVVNSAGDVANLAEKLLDDLIDEKPDYVELGPLPDPDRVEPQSEEEAASQAEAIDALASRSRN